MSLLVNDQVVKYVNLTKFYLWYTDSIAYIYSEYSLHCLYSSVFPQICLAVASYVKLQHFTYGDIRMR